MFEPKEMKVKITLLEPMLGMTASDPKITETYIASKAPDAKKMEEEIEAIGVEGVVEQGKTVFPRDDQGRPFLWDYQIKGFFKDTCGALRRAKGSKSEKIKAFKKEIDGLLFPEPRRIIINVAGEIGDCQRPLRASTPQGDRVALANSEEIPAGSTLEFTIVMLADYREVITEWLDYGRYRGLGQWRNSGKGRFTWEEME